MDVRPEESAHARWAIKMPFFFLACMLATAPKLSAGLSTSLGSCLNAPDSFQKAVHAAASRLRSRPSDVGRRLIPQGRSSHGETWSRLDQVYARLQPASDAAAAHVQGKNGPLNELPPSVGLLARPPLVNCDEGQTCELPYYPAHSSSKKRHAQHPSALFRVLPVRRRIFVLTRGGSNSIVQAGREGVLVVDTQLAEQNQALVAAIKKISDKPLRYVINTNADADHIGGNGALRRIHEFSSFARFMHPGSATSKLAIYAHENVLKLMSEQLDNGPRVPALMWPTNTYSTSTALHFNGENIQLVHTPAAHADGDSIVYFDESNVVATGDVFNADGYPTISLYHGGDINGLIAALNRILDIANQNRSEVGPIIIIPGHGRVSEASDIRFYVEMVTTIRTRVKALLDRGMTLEQVQSAQVTLDYDARYGSSAGTSAARKFVGAVYGSLSASSQANRLP